MADITRELAHPGVEEIIARAITAPHTKVEETVALLADALRSMQARLDRCQHDGRILARRYRQAIERLEDERLDSLAAAERSEMDDG